MIFDSLPVLFSKEKPMTTSECPVCKEQFTPNEYHPNKCHLCEKLSVDVDQTPIKIKDKNTFYPLSDDQVISEGETERLGIEIYRNSFLCFSFDGRKLRLITRINEQADNPHQRYLYDIEIKYLNEKDKEVLKRWGFLEKSDKWQDIIYS